MDEPLSPTMVTVIILIALLFAITVVSTLTHSDKIDKFNILIESNIRRIEALEENDRNRAMDIEDIDKQSSDFSKFISMYRSSFEVLDKRIEELEKAKGLKK